jgi:hypothetical protein
MPFKIGTTRLNMVTLESLGLKDPLWDYQPAATQIKLGTGARRNVGFPIASWSWGFALSEAVYALRAYCPGASSLVYIETPVTAKISGVADPFKVFYCMMHWPLKEEPAVDKRLEFLIEFTQLVLQS